MGPEQEICASTSSPRLTTTNAARHITNKRNNDRFIGSSSSSFRWQPVAVASTPLDVDGRRAGSSQQPAAGEPEGTPPVSTTKSAGLVFSGRPDDDGQADDLSRFRHRVDVTLEALHSPRSRVKPLYGFALSRWVSAAEPTATPDPLRPRAATPHRPAATAFPPAFPPAPCASGGRFLPPSPGLSA